MVEALVSELKKMRLYVFDTLGFTYPQRVEQIRNIKVSQIPWSGVCPVQLTGSWSFSRRGCLIPGSGLACIGTSGKDFHEERNFIDWRI